MVTFRVGDLSSLFSFLMVWKMCLGPPLFYAREHRSAYFRSGRFRATPLFLPSPSLPPPPPPPPTTFRGLVSWVSLVSDFCVAEAALSSWIPFPRSEDPNKLADYPPLILANVPTDSLDFDLTPYSILYFIPHPSFCSSKSLGMVLPC